MFTLLSHFLHLTVQTLRHAKCLFIALYGGNICVHFLRTLSHFVFILVT